VEWSLVARSDRRRRPPVAQPWREGLGRGRRGYGRPGPCEKVSV
jgi:hypothetical protein